MKTLLGDHVLRGTIRGMITASEVRAGGGVAYLAGHQILQDTKSPRGDPHGGTSMSKNKVSKWNRVDVPVDALPILSVTGPATLEFVTPGEIRRTFCGGMLYLSLMRNLCRRALDFIFILKESNATDVPASAGVELGFGGSLWRQTANGGDGGSAVVLCSVGCTESGL